MAFQIENPFYDLNFVTLNANADSVIHVIQSRRSSQEDILDAIYTALHHGKHENLRTLLDHMNEPEQAMMRAVEIGSVSFMEILRGMGVSFGYVSPNGDSLFTCAALCRQTDIMNYLLTHGHCTNEQDRSGDTTLTVLCLQNHGYIDEVKELITLGASVNESNSRRLTPLMCAASAGNTSLVHLLLDNCADKDCRDIHGNTAYLLSALHGNYEIFELLKTRTNDAAIANYDHNNALTLALMHNTCAVARRFVDKLVEQGHEAMINTRNNLHDTPLTLAIALHEEDLITDVLTHTSEINQANYTGATPFILALQRCKLHICELLILMGCQRSAGTIHTERHWWCDQDILHAILMLLDVSTSPSPEICETANQLFFGSGEIVPLHRIVTKHPIALSLVPCNTSRELRHMCRVQIRQTMCNNSETNLLWLIERLPLPTALREYLALKH